MAVSEVPTVLAPVPDVVERLESILEMAKAGRVRSMAVAAVLSSGESMSAWAGCYGPITLVGQMEVLKREVMDAQIDLPDKPAGQGYEN